MSSITLAELEYGVYRSSAATLEQNRRALDALIRVIPAVSFDRSAAKAYAEVRAAAPKRQQNALDKLIASHAISLNVTLVTNDLNDFRVYPGIRLENWVVDSQSSDSGKG